MADSSPQPYRRFEWNYPLGRPECPYMYRWKVSFGRLGSIRIHHWLRSDDARYRHDHPADFITLVLKGAYTDVGFAHRPSMQGEYRERMTPGCIRRRKAEHKHTVFVDPGGCWTLVYFFPKRRAWGFWVPRKSDDAMKFKKANKYFLEHGHHPCDQP